jgi:LysR family glycine cleavage system transcriptional activator
MASHGSKLPPMNSLVAFEAAARHLNFTHAAKELGVSREAISRHIRNLENHLGAALFRRLHRTLELTKAGRDLEPVIHGSLAAIAQASQSLRRAGQPARVTVTATIAIASFWLTPRLSRFRARSPDSEIHMIVSDQDIDMAADGVDVGLRYGDGDWPGLEATRLFDTETFPVCAPGYLETAPALASATDLRHQTLLNLDGTAHSSEDWAWWLAGNQVTMPPSSQLLGFDNYANVIQAAVDGQGVALGFSPIVDELLGRGQLIRPLDHSLSKGYSVYLVVPAGAALNPGARDFFDWVIAEAATQTN